MEFDIRFGPDLLYAPDIVFIAAGRTEPRPEKLTVVPDFVVEVLSPATRALDQQTKGNDYERCGVKEYWMVDPATAGFRVLRLKDGKYTEFNHDGDRLESTAVPGFSIDLGAFKKRVLG
jgi:Uma2 family endonuclease